MPPRSIAADDGRRIRYNASLRIEDGNLISLWIVFPEPVHTIELHIDGSYLAARAFANGALVSEVLTPESGSLGFQATGIDCIVLFTSDNCEVARICYQTEAIVHRLREDVRAQPKRLRTGSNAGRAKTRFSSRKPSTA